VAGACAAKYYGNQVQRRTLALPSKLQVKYVVARWDTNGLTFRLLNIVDDFNRQVFWIEPDVSIPADRVIRVLDQLRASRGLPETICVDNGPELNSTKWISGAANITLPWPSYSQENQPKTHLSNDLTDHFELKCSMPIFLKKSMKFVAKWIGLFMITITTGRMTLKKKRRPCSCSKNTQSSNLQLPVF
jgi:hypothetical protein